jgi:hypothetical protein
MNALPSLPRFDRQNRAPLSRKSSAARKSHHLGVDLLKTPKTGVHIYPSDRCYRKETTPMQVKSNPAYVHRRQGLEAVTKLVTYSTLSVFGVVTLVNSIGYNWAQHSKLQHLETELQDAKARTEKINSNFTRSFDPAVQKSVMEDNSYKVAPDRLQIFLVNPTTKAQTAPTARNK